jgi:hypothetical protein
MTRRKQEGPLEGAFLLAHPYCTFTPASRCNIAPALTRHVESDHFCGGGSVRLGPKDADPSPEVMRLLRPLVSKLSPSHSLVLKVASSNGQHIAYFACASGPDLIV